MENKILVPPCDGNGVCLKQTNLEDSYTRWFNCQYACKPEPCSNFFFCGSKHPKWTFDCHGNMCGHCSLIIGVILDVDKNSENVKCGSCMKTTTNDIKMVQLQSCTHKLCLNCLRYLVWGKSPIIKKQEEEIKLYDPNNDEQEIEEEEEELTLLEIQKEEIRNIHEIQKEEIRELGSKCPFCRTKLEWNKWWDKKN